MHTAVHTGAAPPRTAMARVHMGRRSPPVALELEVGPLPRPTYYKVVSTQHWHMRQISTPEYNRCVSNACVSVCVLSLRAY